MCEDSWFKLLVVCLVLVEIVSFFWIPLDVRAGMLELIAILLQSLRETRIGKTRLFFLFVYFPIKSWLIAREKAMPERCRPECSLFLDE